MAIKTGNADTFIGDVRTPLMDIEAEQSGQFDQHGSVALAQFGLDLACRGCHARQTKR